MVMPWMAILPTDDIILSEMAPGLYPDGDHWNTVQFLDPVRCADRI